MTISEPFQLYLSSTHSRKFERKEKDVELEALYASYNPGLPGYATVTAQGDGIHVWDLRNLHAVASFSVVNNVIFAVPSFSLNISEGGDKSIISYTVAQSAPDIEQDHGRAVWIIRQGLSGPKATISRKIVVVLPDLVARICGTGHSTVPLLIVSKNGKLSIAGIRVVIKSQLDWPGERKLLETFVFSRKLCSFVQDDDTDSYSSVAVICCQSSTTLQVRLAHLGEEIVPIGTCEIPIASSSEEEIVILAVTCSPSGVLSFFDSRGICATYQLDYLNSSLVSTPIFENLHFRGFTFLNTRKLASRQSFAAVSLGTSIVLLAAEIHQTQDISLQLWDLSFGVLLAAQSMPVPSKIHLSHLSLTVTDEGQVLLTVSPARPEDRQRSSIYVVPVDTPLKSTLATALGKADQTAEWLVPKIRESKNEDESNKIIADVQAFLNNSNNAQKAEKAFLAWVDSHSSKEAALGYEFVKKMLNLVLSPVTSTKAPYTPRIVRCILENAVVSTITLNGRLITMLRQRGDWENVMFALTTVKDVSEDELMAAAKSLIDSHHKRENAMDVDATEGYVPPLWSYLFACVTYPFSPAPMRLAIWRHLSDAQDLVEILEILGNWIHGDQHEVEGLLTSLATNTQVPPSRADLPPYPKVIAFLRVLLDASFVALLQYQPSHDLLRRILSYIEPEINFIDSMEPLRGVLEPFAKAQTLEKKGVSKETPTEWRRRKKQLEQQAGPGVGLYRLEELMI